MTGAAAELGVAVAEPLEDGVLEAFAFPGWSRLPPARDSRAAASIPSPRATRRRPTPSETRRRRGARRGGGARPGGCVRRCVRRACVGLCVGAMRRRRARVGGRLVARRPAGVAALPGEPGVPAVRDVLVRRARGGVGPAPRRAVGPEQAPVGVPGGCSRKGRPPVCRTPGTRSRADAARRSGGEARRREELGGAVATAVRDARGLDTPPARRSRRRP